MNLTELLEDDEQRARLVQEYIRGYERLLREVADLLDWFQNEERQRETMRAAAEAFRAEAEIWKMEE